MTTVIEQMLKKYDSKNMYDQKNAMKEVMQEIVLYGLSAPVSLRKLHSWWDCSTYFLWSGQVFGRFGFLLDDEKSRF